MNLSSETVYNGRMNSSPKDSAPPEESGVSAFPHLPESPDQLPEIPGGWTEQEIQVGPASIRLMRPSDPDLFLDDAQVHRENEKNDYMPYWAFLWPSAIKMAAAVLNAEWPVGTSVLELGAGIGLVGLASQLRGDHVTYSDYDATALHLCRLNARNNQLPNPDLLQLDWREVPNRTYPVLMGCEVTYDAALHEPLLKLIQRMLAPGGVCWLGDPGRYQAQFFYQLAVDHGFRVRIQNERGEECPTPLSNEFQILKLDRS
ncbi:class I SAM-dependent methyltransferase [Planctomicrobium sp. SH661]|uniref:class I SAM-dependent methyltransferase n=1 Tax=Planctomicrobium sp. SH661 TaxID=3448124 RepID=UPI003F5C05EC